MKTTLLFLLLISACVFGAPQPDPSDRPMGEQKSSQTAPPLGVGGLSFALIVKAGTMGISPEVSYRLRPRVNLRASVSFLNYQKTDEVLFDQGKDLEKVTLQYDAQLQLRTAGLLVDYHPFKRFLALNLGVFYNNNGANVALIPKSDIILNDRVFKPEETGTLGLKVHYQKWAPYAGLSLGNPHNGKFRVLFDVGVLYTGSPKITMTGTGAIEPTSSQAPQLQENLKPLYLYPVMKLGFSYRIY